MKKLIILIFIFTANLSFACSCMRSPKDFNLLEYDDSKGIHEYKVISEIEYTDSIEKKLNYGYRNFKIEVINTFKGNYNKKIDTLKQRTFSSCSTYPKVGKTYISYSYDNFPNYTFCARKLRKDRKYFENEKSILNKLKESKGKLLILNESDFKLVTGKFRCGKRHGIWKIYYPISDSNKKEVEFLELKYKRGKLVFMKNNTDAIFLMKYRHYLTQTEKFYYKNLSVKGKKKYELQNDFFEH